MSLHQVELGTSCKVLSTGKEGTLKKIFHFPTRFEIEMPDGKTTHLTSYELEFANISRLVPQYNRTSILPSPETNYAVSSFSPFCAESVSQQFFSTTPDILWKTLTSLNLLNVWMPHVQRALPIVDVDRYVSRFSFDRIALKAGTTFKIRPFSLSKYFTCKIISIESQKEWVLEMRYSPLFKETLTFSLESLDKGVILKCAKKSEGLFSFLSNFRFYSQDALALKQLETIVPKVDFTQTTDGETSQDDASSKWDGFASRENFIAYAINMGIQGNMDVINAIPEKPTRGLAKAGLVKAKRTGVTPPMPEKPEGGVAQASPSAGTLSKEDVIAFAVNKALDGDKEPINSIEDKASRGKAKALVVKINRGKAEPPAMPEMATTSAPKENTASTESETDLIQRLVAQGLEGNMDEINALESRVLRGKIKSAVVKTKRKKS